MSVQMLAGGPGPAMFLGSSIMSFALPYAAFIVAAVTLFIIFRAKHSGPRLKYSSHTLVTSVTTREPGPVPAPAAKVAEDKVAEEPSAEAPGGEPAATAGERPAGDAMSEQPAGDSPEGDE